jgi:hypothetical protein
MLLISTSATLAEDFDKITLDESRAVLCVHMLCYILDGDIGFSELSLVSALSLLSYVIAVTFCQNNSGSPQASLAATVVSRHLGRGCIISYYCAWGSL